MASPTKIDYEIITDLWDPKCVSACSMYLPGEEPEDTELLLEKIRGKLDERIHNHTQSKEYAIINDQIMKSQGFDSIHKIGKPDTGRVYFGRLAAEAVEIYNKGEGTSFEFVEVEKANIYLNSGKVYFITFVAKDPLEQTKVFPAKRFYTASVGANPINKTSSKSLHCCDLVEKKLVLCICPCLE
ncbi:hypothetical protein Bca52824_036044 [Brassica carinata]|uniref:Cystatin domain-containing protein n=1 Tax=Brassica carinata TaxID=52824 RepID=A0A8X7S480_BRACI|nr:hypothetical protein Bca52824_036044 [Brassica carinata]